MASGEVVPAAPPADGAEHATAAVSTSARTPTLAGVGTAPWLNVLARITRQFCHGVSSVAGRVLSWPHFCHCPGAGARSGSGPFQFARLLVELLRLAVDVIDEDGMGSRLVAVVAVVVLVVVVVVVVTLAAALRGGRSRT